MFERSLNLISPATSAMWVERLTLGLSRWERSHSPVSVGAMTTRPRTNSRTHTRTQHHPPCQAPWTSRNVVGLGFRGVLALAAIGAAPSSAPAKTARRCDPVFFGIVFPTRIQLV